MAAQLQPLDREVATPTDHRVADGRFRLLQTLPSGTDAAAYSAIDRETGECVEIRHYHPGAAATKFEAVCTRVRLLQLLWHQGARRIRWKALDKEPFALVLQHGGDESLRRWALGSQPSSRDLLRCLLSVAECLAEAHHVGLTHGSLSADAIGVVDGLPRLDFTQHPEDLDSPPPVGSLQAKVEDCQSFAEILAWVLTWIEPGSFHQSSSHRDLAQLRQLASFGRTDGADVPEIGVYASSLNRMLADLRLEGLTSTPETAENKSCSDDHPPLDSESTAEIARPAQGEPGTAELARPLMSPTGGIAVRRQLESGDRVGRYRIEYQLGQGGMGTVYKAIDLGTGEPVAIKILNHGMHAADHAIRRFAKEARMLAALNSPYLTNLIEVNDHDGFPFIAVEFVDGVNLAQILACQRRLAEATALSIAADVARALIDAHQREIVHRDIKPANILLVGIQPDTELNDLSVRAKLTDFGIARHVNQSESLAVTHAGSLIGSPTYISPEQCRGQGETMPQSDIYSLGVTLFELLAGRPPFVSEDPLKLAGMHCFDDPPSLQQLNATVSQPVAELVARCLSKRPEDRFADASHFLARVELLLRGEATDATIRPMLPPHDANRIIGATMVWNLQSTPETLWPWVSNTERLNRAIGLPTVEYSSIADEALGVRRFGTIRIAGIGMTWEEHPFEWIEGRRMSVLREFSGGPFHWFVNTVELLPTKSGGTELRHTTKILPRNFFGTLIAKVETGTKCHRALDKVYQRIDATISSLNFDSRRDAFEAPPKLSRDQQARILDGMRQLERAGTTHEVIDALTQFLLEAPEPQVSKIRPVALARQLQLDESEVIDALLFGAHQGLFQLQWDLLCPTCRVAADTRPSLTEVAAHTRCEACDLDFQSDVSTAVELVFSVHSALRHIQTGKYCIGGPWHAPHVVAQLRLEPHECLEIELQLGTGDYVLRGPRLAWAFPIRVQSHAAPSRHQWNLGDRPENNRTSTLRAGAQLLTITNPFEHPQLVRIERTLSRDDSFTAVRASATPRFRELFPRELLQEGQLISTDRITMLAVAIPSIDDLFVQCGDATAYRLVEKHVEDAAMIVRQHGGDVVKVVGDIVFASFDSTLFATQAAFHLRVSQFTSPDDPPLRRAIGVNAGPALVTTVNNRLDYFGGTARQTMALPTAIGDGIGLTETTACDSNTADWLRQERHIATICHIALPGKPNLIVHHFV